MKTLAQLSHEVDELLIPAAAAQDRLDQAIQERMTEGMAVHVRGPSKYQWPEDMQYDATIRGHLPHGEMWVVRDRDGEDMNIMTSWTAEYWSL